jgi:hypothetical protein
MGPHHDQQSSAAATNERSDSNPGSLVNEAQPDVLEYGSCRVHPLKPKRPVTRNVQS